MVRRVVRGAAGSVPGCAAELVRREVAARRGGSGSASAWVVARRGLASSAVDRRRVDAAGRPVVVSAGSGSAGAEVAVFRAAGLVDVARVEVDLTAGGLTDGAFRLDAVGDSPGSGVRAGLRVDSVGTVIIDFVAVAGKVRAGDGVSSDTGSAASACRPAPGPAGPFVGFAIASVSLP
ncbi:hypothetical protein AB0F81_50610 [Actinoplanes sp. NPDC024001]|uniref:hypothetical protein n=1 Tax=Actinoplanes sp. NPDC024001 TaxID=3154598 RepID=UPI0033F7DFBD